MGPQDSPRAGYKGQKWVVAQFLEIPTPSRE